jgi:iron complex outermembrane receptor protein
MLKKSCSISMVLLVLICSTTVYSQTKKDTISLSEIILIGSPIKNVLQKTAAAISVISTADINRTDGITLTPVLNKIPGVFMQQGTANTNRITIRGIGARSQYSTNRVKAYFDGIPLTTAEGETVIEDIDIASIEKIEMIKGPNSSSFGSGMGGVINLFSRETPLKESYGKYNTNYGSFGLMQRRLSAGYSNAKTNLYTSYSDIESNEFRANSAYNRKGFNLFAKQKIPNKGNLSFIGIFTKLKSSISSSLSKNDFTTNPERAATTWAAAQGYKSYDKILLGIGYEHHFSEKWSLNSSVFSNFRNAYEARPFDILGEKTNNRGLRLNINYKDNLFSLPFELSFGTELATEKYQNSLYKNLYLSQPGKGSLQGNEFSSIEQNRNYSNYFLQMEFWISKNLHLESGIALNATTYSLKDVFTSNTKTQNYTFGTIASPRIGLSYTIGHGKNIYTSISKGFSVPTVAETLTPSGLINTDLKPEVGWNYEIGFKGNWLANKLYTEAALFSTKIENLLVARRTADDKYVGINAGSSSHLGIEFVVNYKLLQSKNLKITPYLSGVVNYFKFKDFVDRSNDYSGNMLTNVPSKQLNFGLDLSTKYGFSINTSYRIVGEISMNDANSLYTAAYALLDIKTTYAFTILKYLKTELTAGVNNALNEKYAASIVPNALGIGTAPPRYYYPGNPVNYYAGISISYLFDY